MSKRLVLAIPIATTVVGLCVGLWVAYQTSQGVFTKWKSLEAPPEKVSRIVTATLTTVYVQTVQEGIYACSQSYSNECWHRASLPTEIRLPRNCDTAGYSPKLPCKANDGLTFSICDEETIETEYVLCEDGKVWMWQQRINPISLPIDYAMIVCPFCSIGLVAGIAPIVVWRKKRVNESRA